MRILYIVVHPESTHHVDGLVGGQYDSHLTLRGLEATNRIADCLYSQIPQSEHGSIEIYSSDLSRCKQTALPMVEKFNGRIVLDKRLREKSYGIAEGKPQSWMKERFIVPPGNPASHDERLHHFDGIEGSETKAEWVSRIYDAVDDILSSKAEYQIVVTHGGSFTFVVAAWIGMSIKSVGYVNFHAPPGSVTVLKEDTYWGNRGVESLGDVRHLEGL